MRFMPMYLSNPEASGSSIRSPLQLMPVSCARILARSKGKRRRGCAVRRSIS